MAICDTCIHKDVCAKFALEGCQHYLKDTVTPQFVSCPKGFKGVRDTRYYCPNCKKAMRRYETFCHNCGQAVKYPKEVYDKPNNKMVLVWDAAADRCVCCGDVIPEGRQVCPKCEGGGNGV